VVGGFHRDTTGRRLELPVFSREVYARDQRMRGWIIDFRCPVESGKGARVDTGDSIAGDLGHDLEISQGPRLQVAGERGID
jgi:regulator of RNase E activity RraA